MDTSTLKSNYPDNSLVVVADGVQATLFRLHYDNDSLSLKTDSALQPESLEDDGPSGVRPPETTPGGNDEATFAKQLAQHLNSRAESNDFQSLVLIADPQTLGQIRPILSQAASSKVTNELAKTLTTSPVDEIVRSLEANARA